MNAGLSISATPPDVLPLLPLGAPVFHSLPGRALVLEELAPAVGDGIVVLRLGESSGGVVLVSAGAIAECFCLDDGALITGEDALRRMSRWGDAAVSASQLSVAEANLVPPLFQGDPVYEDLRLKWLSWPVFLSDLRQRPGAFVVELTTPTGRGVTSIREGTHVASYTDQHPGLGDPTVLDELAESGSGTIRVLRESVGAAMPMTEQPATEPVDATEEAEPVGPVVALDTPLGLEPEPQMTTDEEEESGSFTNVFGMRQETAYAPAAIEESEPAPAAAAVIPFIDLLPDLKLLVRSRLQMSSPRVEILLEDAAAADRPLDWVAAQVRTMSIRGVQQPTLERLADDMLALAGQRPH